MKNCDREKNEKHRQRQPHKIACDRSGIANSSLQTYEEKHHRNHPTHELDLCSLKFYTKANYQCATHVNV